MEWILVLNFAIWTHVLKAKTSTILVILIIVFLVSWFVTATQYLIPRLYLGVILRLPLGIILRVPLGVILRLPLGVIL